MILKEGKLFAKHNINIPLYTPLVTYNTQSTS